MTKCIENTKLYIDRQVKFNRKIFIGDLFDKFQKVFLATNENINGYLSNIDFMNKEKVLSVLSGGDHVLNLVEKGILNIDTFDINRLTEFFALGLKFGMIRKYNYEHYLKTFLTLTNDNTSLEELTTIINELLPYMENKYKKYWKEINEFNYKLQKQSKTNLNLINMLSMNELNLENSIYQNSYLSNEISYQNLKDNLNKTKITFKNINAIELNKKYDTYYDLILLSNIVGFLTEYFYRYNFIDYIENLRNMLTEDGILFLEYIQRYKINDIKRNIFVFSSITDNDLKHSSIIELDNINEKDAVLVLRKK